MSPPAKKRHTRKQRLPLSERDLWLRLVTLWVVAAAMTVLLQSDATSAFFRHPLMETVTPLSWPFILSLALFIFIGMAVRSEVRSQPQLAQPSFEQSILAFLGTGLLLLLSLWLLHPSPEIFAMLMRFSRQHPVIGDPLLAALLGAIMLLPALALPLVGLPLSLLRTHRLGILLGWLGTIGFLLFPALESFYFGITGPPLVTAIQWILRLLPGNIPFHMSRWEVGYEGFTATVGYACTEFSSVALFLGLFGVALYSLSKKQSIAPLRAIIALITGIILLWILNVLRIAAIVVIGSFHRVFALQLFHSGIGVILFLLFFLVFIKLSLPFMQTEKKRKDRPKH